MQRTRSSLLLLVPAVLVSCALPLDSSAVRATSPESTDSTEAAESAAAADAGELDDEPDADADAAIEPEPEPVLPSGTFATIDALCREQMKMVVPHLRAAEQRSADGSENPTRTPLCRVSTTALAGVSVVLRAPFLEVKAIEIETGLATQTHLVTRTAAGWFALGRASMTDEHDDPGCFSIERDTGIVSVRVEGTTVPALVVVESSSRGAEMEEEQGELTGSSGAMQSVTWDDVSQRARACRAEASGYVACDAPTVIHTERVPSTTGGGRQVKALVTRDMTVDATGHLRVSAR